MTSPYTSAAFKAQAARAVDDPRIRKAQGFMRAGFEVKRAKAVEKLPEFEALRDEGRRIKDHVLEHLDLYLERFEAQVRASGGQVHWARTAEEARAIVLSICRGAGATKVAKGKSMVSEEIALNDALEEAGIRPVETDLGEYIIQLRREPPSHIVAPAIHLSRTDVEAAFRAAHIDLEPGRDIAEPAALVAEARRVLRQEFLSADVGITGANFLIAETGSTVIVTNEGNGDLSQSLPRTHIVLAGIEKVVPTLEDASTLLRLLARSATGQEFSVYTTLSTGPKRAGDPDGPSAFHVVLVDNGRSSLIGTQFQDVLRCIRCGACMNHCPVYQAIGGHAYGWVYPGPIGAALTPGLLGLEESADLPNASTFCGKCESVCPVKIPLPRLMRHWREAEWERGLSPPTFRSSIRFWAWFARRPALYRRAAAWAMPILGLLGRGQGRIPKLPGLRGWTRHRDFPAPQGRTFQQQWAARCREAGR